MFILFALQLTLSIWIFVQNDKFLTKMGELVDSAWNQNDAAQGYPMDALQISVSCKRNSHFTYFSYRIEFNHLSLSLSLQFTCCGKNNYEDYVTGSVPASCCGYKDRTRSCDSTIYTERPGCQQKFNDFWASYTDLISWSSLIIALFELGIFVISCCLASAMRKSR